MTSKSSCVAGAFATRFINQPNLPGGKYDLFVDGAGGASGDYTVKFETRPPAAAGKFGYWFPNMVALKTTGTYTSIAGTGTRVVGFAPDPGAFNRAYSVNLPFTFDFYGTAFTSLNISSNMFLSFDPIPTGATAYDNECNLNTQAPTATAVVHNVIAPFWDQGYPEATSDLLTKVEGTAPFRRLIIEFVNWDTLAACNPAPCGLRQFATLNHQVILYEDGDIEFRYGPRTAPTMNANKDCQPRQNGCSATIGISNGGGTDFDQYQCFPAGTFMTANQINNGDVIYYVHPR
jgi:hypothetical protein